MFGGGKFLVDKSFLILIIIINKAMGGVDLNEKNNAESSRVPSRRPIRHIKSETLFEGQVEVIIDHREEEYRLRLTKSDKLILTK